MDMKNDGQQIYRHFKRFAEYEDLKELYSKVVPEIAKFEGKLIEFTYQNQQTENIIRRFDENLTNKADKYGLKNVYDYLNKTYIPKQQQEEF